jgi:peptidoglycan/LPS O-acetylase OafA/YrhL
MTSVTRDAAAAKQEPPIDYYPHIEGLRGVTALYVVLYHVWQNGIVLRVDVFGAVLPVMTRFLAFGHYAVAVFIVISGYCLGLPVLRGPTLPFDPKRFAKRRARRLLPAYMLVLSLSLIPFAITHSLRGDHVPISHVAASFVTHVLLIHNLYRAAALSINAPMWSIALECQIYVVFALVLVPVWRRYGWCAQLVVAVALGILPHFALHGGFDWTAPWMLGLFGMGFAAAANQRSGGVSRWAALGAAFLALGIVLPSSDPSPNDWAKDSLVGVAVALFLLTSASAGRSTLVGRALSAPFIIALGTFSYSLYLVHGPLVAMTCAALARYHVGVVGSLASYAGLVVATLGVAYGLYRVAELPFMSAALRSSNEKAVRSPESTPAGAPNEFGSKQTANIPGS